MEWRGVANKRIDQSGSETILRSIHIVSHLPTFQSSACAHLRFSLPKSAFLVFTILGEMTYSRTFLIPNQTGPKTLRGRLFSTRRPRAFTVKVPFATTAPTCPIKARFVVSEACFYDAERQPYIHSTLVTAKFRGRRYCFKLYYKNHVALPLNHSLPELAREGMRGDVLAIAYGPKVGERSFTGMETAAADSVVRR